MEENIEFRKVRSFGDLVGDSFIFVTRNWKPLLKSYYSICGFFVLGAIVTGILQQNKVISLVNSGAIYQSPYSFWGWESALSFIFALLSFISLSITVLSFISLYNEKGNVAPSVEEVWAYFKYFFFRLLGAHILLGLLLIFALVCIVVPAIYLWPVTSVILAVMVFENASIGYSFDRAFRLIKSQWWITFGAFFVTALIVYAGTIMLVMPVSFLTGARMATGGFKSSLTGVMVMTVIQYLCQVFWVLLFVVISLAYFSLAERIDGSGLRERINSIGKDDDDALLPMEEY